MKTNPNYALAIAMAVAGILPAEAQLQHEQIALANETMFNESYFSQPLTGYAVGWRDPRGIQPTLEYLFPPVMVPRRFDYAELTNAEEFLADENTDLVRSIGGDFKLVKPYTETKTHKETPNKGLRIRVDLDRVADKKNWQQQYTGKLLRRIWRSTLISGFTLASAAAVNTGKVWGSSADADQDLDDQIGTSEDISGLPTNRILFGRDAWALRRRSYRAQNNAAGYASAASTQEELASYLNIDSVLVSKERYQSSASAKSQVVGSKVLLFNAADGLDEEDPSNFKLFYTLCEGGTRYRVFVQQISAKIFEITVECYDLLAVTSTLGIRQLTVTAS